MIARPDQPLADPVADADYQCRQAHARRAYRDADSPLTRGQRDARILIVAIVGGWVALVLLLGMIA